MFFVYKKKRSWINLSGSIFCIITILVFSFTTIAGAESIVTQSTSNNVNLRTEGYGFDCGVGMEFCPNWTDWSWLQDDPQIPGAVPTAISGAFNNQRGFYNQNNQAGGSMKAGSSSADIGMDVTQVALSPHFIMKFFNTPCPDAKLWGAPCTSVSPQGYTSSLVGNLRDSHNEFGFEIIIDKKTDPLDPYYQEFDIFYIVDYANDSTGDLYGDANIYYEKRVTEMDVSMIEMGGGPVFNTYTVTGTATSNGGYTPTNWNAACQTGCTSDPETSNWPTHPWDILP